MIQLSYDFDGDPPTVAAPLRANVIAAADGRARLTGHWPHRDLAAARRQVAAVMATMPADRSVRCLFTGRTKPAATWVTELTAPPTVATVFEARHGIAEGRLWARLFGGYQLGESDIVLLADATADVAEVYRFLSAWGAYRLGATEGAEPAWDRPFPWGYHLVSFAEHDVGDADFWALCRELLGAQHLRGAFDERMASPPPRVVIEAAAPGDPDTSYMIGATAALASRARQRATRERLGADDAPSPSALDAAGYCDRLLAAWDSGGDPDWFAYREAPRGELDSGWRLGCVDPAHVHDDRSLRIDNLRRARPLCDYLALPPGWVVTREDGAFWTSAPGEAESHRDDAP